MLWIFSFEQLFGVMFTMLFSEKCSRRANAFTMERLMKAGITQEKQKHDGIVNGGVSGTIHHSVLVFVKVNT